MKTFKLLTLMGCAIAMMSCTTVEDSAPTASSNRVLLDRPNDELVDDIVATRSCGDGVCDQGEEASTCPNDCPIACGDGICADDEFAIDCPADCASRCGDGICDADEDATTCAEDCTVFCGNRVCEGEEGTSECPEDCGSVCGDGACNGDESTISCAADCGSVCGDGSCNGGETTLDCSSDCGSLCGDESCNGDESNSNCPEDCDELCGDGVCSENESAADCSSDCGAICGDGQCAWNDSENCASCPSDCGCDCTEVCTEGFCLDDACAPCAEPQIEENCDQEDNDCDGQIDEGFPNLCEGKQCGGDGCGGYCGLCANNETCTDGLCICVSNCEIGSLLNEVWGASCVSPPCEDGYAAELLALNFAPAIPQGGSATMEMELLNIGSETWSTANVKLGAVDNEDPLSNQLHIDLPHAVAPGEVVTVSVAQKAPSLSAPRRVLNVVSDWQLRVQGNATQWFGPTISRWISVYDATPVATDSLAGKVLAGYQGWFATPGAPESIGWNHWSKYGLEPTPDTVSFDLWPDLREFSASELVETSYEYPNGSPVGLYSAYKEKTIDRHVRWMKEYGLHGLWLQRFASELQDWRFLDFRDVVAGHVKNAAEAHGRAFAMMYDISGMQQSPSIFDQIVNDWKHLVDDLGLTDSDRYMHHNGRPVLAIWGFGFKDRPGNAIDDENLIDYLQNGIEAPYRVTVLGGVPEGWRTHSGASKANYQAVYNQYDLISPWSVGRYNDNGYNGFKQNYIQPDLAQKGAANYIPVIWPGFSWTNLMANVNQEVAALNHIPRLGGDFLWHQAWGAHASGATMGYIAMFDEVDEATAIYKAAENASQKPTTGTFLTLDADGHTLPSDWYLRLAGEVVNLFQGVYSWQPEHPLTWPPTHHECGNGYCSSGENCATCPTDCGCATGTTCQNQQCLEGPSSGVICGDNACNTTENCTTCPGDCPCAPGKVCDNHQCVTDNTDNCSQCGPGFTCDDGQCACGPVPHYQEKNGACLPSCGAIKANEGWSDSTCSSVPCSGASAPSWDCNYCCEEVGSSQEAECGDGVCAPGLEDCGTCANDCPCAQGTSCQNNICHPAEYCGYVECMDCLCQMEPACCGDFTGSEGELYIEWDCNDLLAYACDDACNCGDDNTGGCDDCGPGFDCDESGQCTCGPNPQYQEKNGACLPSCGAMKNGEGWSENACSSTPCPGEGGPTWDCNYCCEVTCGDNVCHPDESSSSCPQDCDSFCGDGGCNAGESNDNCPDDCGGTCGDGVCQSSEDALNCATDCSSSCDTGQCAGNDALFTDDGIIETLACGAAQSAYLTVQNIGTTTWSRDKGYKLGAHEDEDPLYQGGTRVYLPEEVTMPPGESWTFEFDLLGPQQAGTYLSDWRMVHEAVEWFGPVISRDVEVICTDDDDDQTEWEYTKEIKNEILASATYVRNNYPQFFDIEDIGDHAKREIAYDMMTTVINHLRDKGVNASRCIANPGLAESDPFHWCSDALCVGPPGEAVTIDVFYSWSSPATPHTSMTQDGGQTGVVTDDLNPLP